MKEIINERTMTTTVAYQKGVDYIRKMIKNM